MTSLIPIRHHKKSKFSVTADVVVKGSGLDFEEFWSKNEGVLIFSPKECRRLLKFYSLETLGGKLCDYRMDKGENLAHFFLLS